MVRARLVMMYGIVERKMATSAVTAGRDTGPPSELPAVDWRRDPRFNDHRYRREGK